MSEWRERSDADRQAERRRREEQRSGRRAGSNQPRRLKVGEAGAPPVKPAAARRTTRSQPSRRPTPGRPRKRRSVIGRVVGVAFLILVAAVIWFLVSLFQPFSGSGAGTGRIEVTVPADATTSQIGTLLVNDKVIGSSFFFALRAKLGGDHFRAGTFAMAHGMSYGAALKELTSAPALPQVTNVTIVPGKSRWQLNQILKSEGVPGSYLKDTVKSPVLRPAVYGAPKHTPSLEGFLYPDTFQLKRPLSIRSLVADQLTEFKHEFAKVKFGYAKSKNLTEYDVLKIASLEEAEAAKPSDLPKVASVIYNRLRLNMDLGLDTTAAYAADNYTGNLSSAQLNSSSPWNTLNHKGLPPTPINSPSLDAIQAAAHPANTNYLYFIVKVCGNGALSFTANYQQFLTWSAAYQRSLDAKGASKTEFCSSRHG
jgi:UPF0755 protein